MDGYHGAVLLNVWSMDQHPSLDSLFLVCDEATTESNIGHLNYHKIFTMLRTFHCFLQKLRITTDWKFYKEINPLSTIKAVIKHFHKELYSFIETIIAGKSC